MVDMVDDYASRRCRIVDAFQSRIELFDEGEIQSAARGMLRQIQTRDADQVEPREVVRRPQNPADGQVRRLELFQAANMSLGRPRLRRSVAETYRPSDALRHRDQASKFVPRKQPKADFPIRLPLDQVAHARYGFCDRGIGVSGGLHQPVGGDRTSVRQPMVQEDLEHDE